MDRDYDIFEILSDGMGIWRATVDGREDGIHKLDALAKGQSNEFRLIQRPTKAVVATLNGPNRAQKG